MAFNPLGILGAGTRLFNLPGASLTKSLTGNGITGLVIGVVGFLLLLTFIEALINKAV
jgi:hypothetical protein